MALSRRVHDWRTQTTLYRAFDTEGRLLYVGISDMWSARFQQHSFSSGWFGYCATMTLEGYDSRREAEIAELAAIRAEDPIFNRSGVSGDRWRRWHVAFWSDRHADDISDDEMRAWDDELARQAKEAQARWLVSRAELAAVLADQ